MKLQTEAGARQFSDLSFPFAPATEVSPEKGQKIPVAMATISGLISLSSSDLAMMRPLSTRQNNVQQDPYSLREYRRQSLTLPRLLP